MKITKGTIIRTIMLAIVLINYALKSAGINVIPWTEEEIGAFIEAVVSIGAIAASWWYNNSFSENAKKADDFFKMLNSADETTAGDDDNIEYAEDK